MPLRPSSPNRSARIAASINRVTRRSRGLSDNVPDDDGADEGAGSNRQAAERNATSLDAENDGVARRVPTDELLTHNPEPAEPAGPEDGSPRHVSPGIVPGDIELSSGIPTRPESPPPPGAGSAGASRSADKGGTAPTSLPSGLSAPPSFVSASGSSRRRSFLWKAESDVALDLARDACMATTHDVRVNAARTLVESAECRARDLDASVAALRTAVNCVRAGAQAMPSTRVPRYDMLMFGADAQLGADHTHRTSAADDGDRSLRDLIWSERIWDAEAALAERRVVDAVAIVEALRADEGYAGCAPTVVAGVETLIEQVTAHLVGLNCATADEARRNAALLMRLGRADAACDVIVNTADALLHHKLLQLQATNVRYVDLVLRCACKHISRTVVALESVNLPPCVKAERSITWATAQTDRVYRAFVRQAATASRGINGTALTQVAGAIQEDDIHDPAAALFRARLLTNLRAHLHDIATDARELLMRPALSSDCDVDLWPPRPAASLVHDASSLIQALAPVLGDVPAVDEGEFDDILVHALLTYATQKRTQRAVAFVGTSVADALHKYRLSAPRANAAATWLAANADVRIAKELNKLSRATGRTSADFRAPVGVTQLHHAVQQHPESPADEKDIREKARQLLAEHRWMPIANGASPAVAVT